MRSEKRELGRGEPGERDGKRGKNIPEKKLTLPSSNLLELGKGKRENTDFGVEL